jgi:hypothetical protein
MEIESTETTSPEITSSQETTAAVETPAQEPAPVTETKQASASEPYNPNFKFKVKDKELEFDDFVKPIIKNKDLESKLREMYEKAHGIDEVKTARETFKTQAEEWKNKFSEVETNLKTLGTYVKKGDFGTFFQALNIPKDQIIRYAIEELKYQELPPEQRAAIEQQRQKELALEQTSSQNQHLQQQLAQMVQQQAALELNQELARPDVYQAISSYDTRAGKPGAFKEEVIRRGQYYEAVHKISPPASQLVSEILTLVGASPQNPQGLQAPELSAPSQAAYNQTQKPVISAFSGSTSKSPARKIPASIDDLRQMRQNLTN